MKILGKFTFAPGSEQFQTPVFAEPSIDEQIENARIFYARRIQKLERDYAQRMQDYQEAYSKEMSELLAKKEAQESQ